MWGKNIPEQKQLSYTMYKEIWYYNTNGWLVLETEY
jgi:hypothetical protein